MQGPFINFLLRMYGQSHHRLVSSLADAFPCQNRDHFIYHDLLWIMINVPGPRSNPSVFAHLERVVIRPQSTSKESRANGAVLKDVLMELSRAMADPCYIPQLKSTWAARIDLGPDRVHWSYGFDFKDELPKEEGVLWIYWVPDETDERVDH
jgi:hypothetical protein